MDKETIPMIACVTFETVKVSRPVFRYSANRVYVIHYVRDKDSPNNVFREFFERTRELIKKESNGEAEVVEVSANVSDFTEMLRVVSGIILKESGGGQPIYVNLSSGSPEYITAASVACMMSGGKAHPFFVRTADYQVSGDRIRDVYYDGGVPVGLTKEVKDTRDMPGFAIEAPPEYLVRSLRVFKEMSSSGKYSGASLVIAELKRKGLWQRRGGSGSGDAVYYQRMYVDKWVDRGWIVKKKRAEYEVTPNGAVVVDALYAD